jgi:hypothetical protein
VSRDSHANYVMPSGGFTPITTTTRSRSMCIGCVRFIMRNSTEGENIVVNVDRFNQWLSEQRKLTPQHSLRASTLGFPCERRHWYDLTAWAEAALPSVDLQGIFLFGRDYEDMLLRRLTEAGYRWRHAQRAAEWKHVGITGHVEGEISGDGGQTWTLAEIKGLHPHYFDRVSHWRNTRPSCNATCCSRTAKRPS